jgi:hypothetical protein
MVVVAAAPVPAAVALVRPAAAIVAVLPVETGVVVPVPVIAPRPLAPGVAPVVVETAGLAPALVAGVVPVALSVVEPVAGSVSMAGPESLLHAVPTSAAAANTHTRVVVIAPTPP